MLEVDKNYGKKNKAEGVGMLYRPWGSAERTLGQEARGVSLAPRSSW